MQNASMDQQVVHYTVAASQAAQVTGASTGAAQHGVKIKIRLSSLHLEEAVEQGRLAVLNHDVPDFNLHTMTAVSSSFRIRCALQASRILSLTTSHERPQTGTGPTAQSSGGHEN